ncbi:hypothetical protein LLG90_20405 [Aromatoleum toluclasticum]|uniref:hypothetical protein n=1 Tax=Aromatoleum toluclasticum TaxID=92003 RepID=UPI001D187F4D|nr:hypothetical protein [Aromatoleum toluclasticum]MCC4117727.1 hypothetical protein [Aromatoleum toluclasticum]
MRTNLPSLAVAGALAFAATAAYAAAGVVPVNLAPVTAEAARNWRPDERVRSGIDDMRAAIVANASLRTQAATDAARLAELGGTLEARVAAMIACCTQDGVASRHLHMLLVEMADGIALMQGAAHADARRMGLLKVVQALNLYGTMFSHSGWRALDETLEVSVR